MSRDENFDVINSTEDTFPWVAEVRPQKHDESQWPLNDFERVILNGEITRGKRGGRENIQRRI